MNFRSHIYRILAVVMVSIFFGDLQSQDIRNTKAITEEELTNAMDDLYDFYMNTTDFSVNMNHSSYKSHDATTPFESSSGYFRKTGNAYVSKMLGYLTIQNAKIKISINTLEKSIYLGHPDTFDPKLFTSLDTKTFLKLCESVQLIEEEESNRYLFNYKPGSQVRNCELLIHEEGWLQEIVFKYEKTVKEPNETSHKIYPKLVIKYQNLVKEKLPEATFFISKYVEKKGADYTLTSQYSNYKLLDYRIK